ncbi:hypothetical protein LZ32DRAFT_54139 [Colletotrichum eremochloae]|nr:hypothetical protein LZ32DRAFT_54139 [Colletotrichum eremochloae]
MVKNRERGHNGGAQRGRWMQWNNRRRGELIGRGSEAREKRLRRHELLQRRFQVLKKESSRLTWDETLRAACLVYKFDEKSWDVGGPSRSTWGESAMSGGLPPRPAKCYHRDPLTLALHTHRIP